MTDSLTVNNDISQCEQLFNFLNSYLNTHNIPEDLQKDLRLIAEEVFANITNYAHDDDTIRQVTIQVSRSVDSISLVFTDDGIAFDPLSDFTDDLEDNDYSQGGMGIQIIRSLSDTLEYERIDGKNVFTIMRNYTQS